MKRTIVSARLPVYSDESGDSINLKVKFKEIIANGEPVEIDFTAGRIDSEPHSRELYAKAKLGNYGTIQPHQPPTEE